MSNMLKLKGLRKWQKSCISAVDLFCGAGGLTRGLADAGINVVAGVDIDPACQYPYEHNNDAKFIKRDIAKLTARDLRSLYPEGHVRVLVGCAPCQPFSKYTQGLDTKEDDKWALLRSFGRLVRLSRPDVVSMENVPELQRHSIFGEFLDLLKKLKYNVSIAEVFCPDYGVAQNRSRLVLFASRFGAIEIVKPTHSPDEYLTVRSAIGHLKAIRSGAIHHGDPMHRSSRLSPLNLRRIRASTPGGTWREWPRSLVAACHRKKTGRTYPGVYGRMEWDTPSPTITTQFFGFGNGRFGHPEQDRGISLREGAILQSFPPDYQFVQPGGEFRFKAIGRLIGNAVPVRLGRVIARSIWKHLEAIPCLRNQNTN
jgi:DNA (cytosine-5)-methyltransferase 1